MHLCVFKYTALDSVCVCVCVRYLQVVDQQLVEGRVGVQVDQETLIVHHSDARRLQ